MCVIVIGYLQCKYLRITRDVRGLNFHIPIGICNDNTLLSVQVTNNLPYLTRIHVTHSNTKATLVLLGIPQPLV